MSPSAADHGVCDAMAIVFGALSHPIRCQLLILLMKGEASAESLSRGFKISRSAISQHLKILVGAELASMARDGRRIYYAAVRDRLRLLHQYLDLIEWPDEGETVEESQLASPNSKRRNFGSKKTPPELIDISYEMTPTDSLKIEAVYR